MTVCLLAWLLLYTGGIVIGTQSFRQELNQDINYFRAVWCWIVIITCYTMTNLALLCCLSATIGALCKGNTAPYYAFLAQGLFVYLILVSGLLLLGNSPFDTTSQSQYTRLAGTASLFSFMIGYNPLLFRRIIEKLEDLTKTDDKDGM